MDRPAADAPAPVLADAAARHAPSAAAAPPANDPFAAPTVLGALPASVPGTIADATRETGEPRHAERTSPSVWYAITPTEATALRARTCDNDFDTVLAVYTGGAVGALREVVSNDDACGRGSEVTWSAAAGTTYRIAVASYTDQPGDDLAGFTLRVDRPTPPANDAFADALVLRGPDRVRGSNVLATRELGEPRHARQDGGGSVWFRYRATRSQTLTADTFGSNFDTALAIYRGDLGSLRQVAANDDAPGPDVLASEARFRVRRGRTYFIALDGVDAATGDWELGLSDGGVQGVGLSLAVAPDQTLTRLRTSGLRTSVRCIRPCRVRLEARIGATTARSLGLGRRTTTIARTQGSLGGDDPELPAVLRLSRAAGGGAARRENPPPPTRARPPCTDTRNLNTE
ncbi:MAG: hypothetical protein ACR2GL_04325, partial [Thermoleophilaceae bacterium]